ncbi:MAG TPA: 3-hydroxyacyl-CoA dehydrogenase NAD-binding domain-containing protein [Burkholderiaceae bacterium]|nr:3-hydroxyacyl-CoA dehydrogenase NAD-binding domain-containing protein [Burkholderiaceae bacterium]
MNTLRDERDSDGIVTLTFDEPDSPVNTMSPAWQRDFAAAVDRLVADKDTLTGVILASAKSSFFAGANLKLLLQAKESDAPRCYEELQGIKRSFRRLETLGKPVVACLNGSALGGGWEVALAAHHRIAVDDSKIQFGTPEVTLGLMPGATGVTKTVRLLGLAAAQPLLLEGKLMRPQDALRAGLVHELVASPAELTDRARAFVRANPQCKQPWDEKDYRIPGGGPSSPKIAQGLAVAPAMLVQRTRGLYPAPEAILASMVEGAQVDFDTALRIESRYLAKLMVGQVAKNMITAFFFNLNAIKSGASRNKFGGASPQEVPRWKAARVGILGAGMMGAGIAYANALRGVPCVLKDVSLERAEAGKAYTRKLTDARIAKGQMDAARQAQVLGLIHATERTADLHRCDLIIEAVFENRALKAQVTQETEPLLAADGIFATNTSTLPITGLARAAARPQNFIGLHFFSPVDKMQLVEIIKGKETSAATLARAYDYVLQIGKTPIVVNDARGFFTSRTFATFVMEGCAMLAEGIPAAVIENAALAAGMPVGPLAVLDETSLSLALHVAEQTKADLAAEGRAYEPPPGAEVIERMVKEFNRPGRAAGRGFYDYPPGEKKRLWPQLKPLFEREDAKWDLPELKDRLLYRQAIEAARCLEERVLTSEHDGNIGSIFGIGFPAWTGGALQFIRSEGLDRFRARAEELAVHYGARFQPPALTSLETPALDSA